MIAIELRFPTGKFHATPWGRQVNEGAVEWPPSPWRLLRALLAVWHYKFPDINTDEMQSLISQLTTAPAFHLPPASQGHTRHYMPVANDKRAKIFDTFVALSPQSPLVIAWKDLDLTPEQTTLLSRLLSAMSYFGRAEAWVEAELVDHWDGDLNAFPLEGRDVGPREELIRLLAPSDESIYSQWREETIGVIQAQRLSEKIEKQQKKGKSTEKIKLSPKELQAIQAFLPTSIFDALQAGTNEIRSAGWNRPPGGEWIDYVRRTDAFAPADDPRQNRSRLKSKRCLPTVARFAIASNVRPLLKDALFIGERIRTAIMSKSRQQQQKFTDQDPDTIHAAEVFSGKTEGNKTNTGHSHAHFLSESNKADGRIHFMSVYAPGGFSSDDELAINNLQKVWGDDGHDLQLVLLGIGQPADFGGQNETLGQSPILDQSKDWKSYTPFVPTDHLKIRNSEKKDPALYETALRRELERVVRKEIQRRSWLPVDTQTVEIEIDLNRNAMTHWRKFRRSRNNGGGQRSSSTGYGVHLHFKSPVQGPIALGYGCHFGLGLFIPDRIHKN